MRLVVVLLTLTACVRPELTRDVPHLPPGDADSLAQRLDALRTAHDDPTYRAFAPHDPWLQSLAGAFAVIGFAAADWEQKRLDQDIPSSAPAAARGVGPLTPALCARARQPVALAAEALAHGRRGGNPPSPRWTPAWLPVPATPGAVPVTHCPAGPAEQGLCLFGRLALQPHPADLVIVVPGLLDSQQQGYVRRAGAMLFSLGLSVLPAQ